MGRVTHLDRTQADDIDVLFWAEGKVNWEALPTAKRLAMERSCMRGYTSQPIKITVHGQGRGVAAATPKW